jgi:hypothetical protein
MSDLNQTQRQYHPSGLSEQQLRLPGPPMGSQPKGYPQRNYDQEAMNGTNPANYLSEKSRPVGVPRPPGKVGFTAQQEAMLARMKSLDCRAGQRPYVPGTVPEGYPVTAPGPSRAQFDPNPFQLEHSANFTTQSQQQRSQLEQLQQLQQQQQFQMKQQQFSNQASNSNNSIQSQNHFNQVQHQQQMQQRQLQQQQQQQQQLALQNKYSQLPHTQIPVRSYAQQNGHVHVPIPPSTPIRVSAARLVHGAPL